MRSRDQKIKHWTTQKKPVKLGKKHAGRWTKKEHDLFLQGLKAHGREWKKVAEMIKSEFAVATATATAATP